MANLVRSFVTTGIAVAGAGLWLAVAPDASAAPEVELAPLSPAAGVAAPIYIAAIVYYMP